MAKQAKQQAIKDIRKELSLHGKCFLAFHSELDPIMEELVNENLEQQAKAHKFKQGDIIEAINTGLGFDRAEVLGTFISTEKRTKGKEMYHLKIMCGTATIPIGAEVNYRLVKK